MLCFARFSQFDGAEIWILLFIVAAILSEINLYVLQFDTRQFIVVFGKFCSFWNDICIFLILNSKKKQDAQRATYRAPEYNVPPFWQIGQGGHLVFPISPKNTNLVEDIKILFPVKFRWIPFSGFRRELGNVSANQRPGRPSCFSDRPENTNLVEDVEI